MPKCFPQRRVACKHVQAFNFARLGFLANLWKTISLDQNMLKKLLFVVAFGFSAPANAQEFLFDSAQWDEMNTYLNQSLEDSIESILEGNPRFEPLLLYGKESAIRALSKPVGKLRIRFDSGNFTSCTATLVGDSSILTNHHCIPGSGKNGSVVQADLEMGYYNIVRAGDYRRFSVNVEPLATSKSMDVSVLKVDGSPGVTYGMANVGLRRPSEGDALIVVHHPGGRVKHITRGGCIAGPVVNEGTAKLAHRCDTLPGSSGAPIFDDKGILIAVHCCGTTVTGPQAFNFARLNELIPEIEWVHALQMPGELPEFLLSDESDGNKDNSDFFWENE